MRILVLAVLLGITMVACVAPDSSGPVSSIDQDLCNQNPDTCPGWPVTTAKQKTSSETVNVFEPLAGRPSATPQVQCAVHPAEHKTSCIAIVSYSGGQGGQVQTSCNFFDDGFWSCEGKDCDANMHCEIIGVDYGSN